MKMKKLLAVLAIGILTAESALCGCASEKSDSDSTSLSMSENETETETAADSEAYEEEDEELTEGEGEVKDTTPILEGEFTLEDCIRLGRYEGLELTEYITTVTDEEAEQYASSLKESVEVTDKNAQVANGDTVTVAFNTFIEGKQIEQLCSDSYDLRVGDATFIVEGFEDALIGMKKGESKDISLTMPESYEDEEYAGKAVRFATTIMSIKRAEEPDSADIEEAKASLQKNNDTNSLNQLRLDAWSQVEAGAEIMYLPQQYIEEAEATFDEITQSDASNYGTDLNGYLETLGLTEEEFAERREQYARYAVRSRLVLEALESILQVSTEDPDYEEQLQEYCDYLGLTKEELIEQNGDSAVRDYIQTQRICDVLISMANVTEKSSAEIDMTE